MAREKRTAYHTTETRETPLDDEPVHRQIGWILRLIWTHPSNRGRRFRRVMLASYFQIRGRVLRKPTLVRLGSRSRMWAHLHMSSTSDVVYANPPRTDLLVWKDVLAPGSLFVDIGANVGVYTMWAIEQGADVIAVEPDLRAVELFRENMKLNGYHAELHEVAVADAEGALSMTQDMDVANHLVLDSTNDSRSHSMHSVRAITLDHLLGDRIADGVKIDIEGAELLALRGAERALNEGRIKLLQLEWNDTSLRTMGQDRRSTADFLVAHGYELFRADDDGILYPLTDWSFGPDVFARPAGS